MMMFKSMSVILSLSAINEHEANSLAMRLLLDLQDHDVIYQLTKYQLMDYLGIDRYLAQYV